MSPDGNWVAKKYESFWHFYSIQVIEVEDHQGEVVWSIPFQGTMESGDPHTQMTIFGWAPDSSGLYFYYAWQSDGWYTLFQGHDLQYLDVKTGELRDILDGCCIAFAFLSDMSQVFYTRGDQVGIYNIADDEDRHVKIRSDPIQQAGYIHVTPDENGMVFTVLMDADANAREIYLDLATMKQTILLEGFIEDFSFDGWTQTENPRYLRVISRTNTRWSYEVIEIDKRTADIAIIGTPTPRP